MVCALAVVGTGSFRALETQSAPGAEERNFLSRVRRLTVEGKRAGEGYWSPDGKRIAFVSWVWPELKGAKAQEKADKAEEGRESLEGDITKARSLLTKLGASGGITSTQKGALANLFTSMSTSSVGQGLGRMVGSQDQSSRDELKSIRLQLLNSIKQATGMGSAQLNSNVELQTWLNSLGSEGMSKETNEEILTNIENKYLKKRSAAPQGLPADAKIVGKTPAGKDVYETPDGKRWVP